MKDAPAEVCYCVGFSNRAIGHDLSVLSTLRALEIGFMSIYCVISNAVCGDADMSTAIDMRLHLSCSALQLINEEEVSIFSVSNPRIL